MNLYAMIQGDELQDVFRDLTSIQMLAGLIFLYTWVFFGMAVITNTFIAIVEQGFLSTKRMTRFEWLKNKQEEEPPAQAGGDPAAAPNKVDGASIIAAEDVLSMKSKNASTNLDNSRLSHHLKHSKSIKTL